MSTITKSRIRRIAPLGAAVFAGITLPLAFTTPAQAHASLTFSGNGNDHGTVNDTHTVIRACDTVADGHGVTVHYTTNRGRQLTRNDPNGSQAGCGQTTLRDGEQAREYKVCTNDVVCSTWRGV